MANVSRRRAIKAIGGAALTTGRTFTAAAAREHTQRQRLPRRRALLTSTCSAGTCRMYSASARRRSPKHYVQNYTLTIGAVTYWALMAIKNKYLKSPGPLVPG